MSWYKRAQDDKPWDLAGEAVEQDTDERIFLAFVIAQVSGSFNMFTEAGDVMQMTGLTGKQYKYIALHYDELEQKFPSAFETAKDFLTLAEDQVERENLGRLPHATVWMALKLLKESGRGTGKEP